jgi:hypothetical protein
MQACGNDNGTLTIGAVTGGTAPYTYSVDGSASTATLVYNNLAAGTHTIDVTDANGCVYPTTATVTGTTGPTAVAVTTTDATCGATNGTLTIGAVTGGTLLILILWTALRLLQHLFTITWLQVLTPLM